MHSKYKKASSRITRRSRLRRIFNLFLIISLPTAFLVSLVFLSRADFLQVKNFEVAGADTIPQESIKSTALNFASGKWLFLVPKSNFFLLSKNKLAAALLAAFPRIEKVDVSKQFFSGSIDLSIVERKADFLWCSAQNECFSMTKYGLVFEKSENAGDKIIFKGVLEGNPLTKNFATAEKMKSYSDLIDVFKNAGFGVDSINIESSDKAVAKVDINNFVSDVILNPEESDLSAVAQNTILLINEIKSKNPSAQFQYIDARFGNKFFYKLI